MVRPRVRVGPRRACLCPGGSRHGGWGGPNSLLGPGQKRARQGNPKGQGSEGRGARPPPHPAGPGSGLTAALEGPNGLPRPAFRLGGGCTWRAPARPGRPRTATGLALPAARFPARSPPEGPARPSSPAQALQLAHGGRQVGDRRQAPGGRLAAEKRLHDGRRPGRGAAGEEQAAAVRGLRAQFHGRARPPRGGLRLPLPPRRPSAPPALAWAARPAVGALGSNTNTTPRFRDAAAAEEAARTGGRAGGRPAPAGATHTHGCFPLTPRGRRAGGRRQPEG